MAKSMVEQGYSAEKIQAEVMKLLRADKAYQMAVAENTKAYKHEVQNIINQTLKDAKEAGNEIVAEAGNMAWNNDLSMWQEHGVDLKRPNSMSQLINAFQAQTAGELKNLTKTIGFKNTVFGTTGVLNAYQREMDLALLKVATGTFSYDQAVNDCVHRLAQSGLRSIDYANGRSYQIDTAARMSVRTGLSQLSGKIMESNLKQTGQDLVITSQHMGSRPEHVPWQNKVFSFSGKNKKYPDFVSSTGYGTPGGLKGVNCTHDFYPFWEGASVIPDDIEYDEEYYKNTQQQRKMERDIRATKREIEAQKAIGGDTRELQSKLRQQTTAYHSFSESVGIRAKDNRLRVVSGSSNLKNTVSNTSKKSQAAKTTGRARAYEHWKVSGAKNESIVNSGERGIINSRNMANGYRKPQSHILTEDEISFVKQAAADVGIPESVLRFNKGTQTGYLENVDMINIRGDIFPDMESRIALDRMSVKAVLAHEYYGHRAYAPSKFPIADWRDEFRASYMAAINAPNLNDEERALLFIDAYDRAERAGYHFEYSRKAKEAIYGYE